MNLLLKYYGKKTLKRNVQLTISNIYFDKNIVSMVEEIVLMSMTHMNYILIQYTEFR